MNRFRMVALAAALMGLGSVGVSGQEAGNPAAEQARRSAPVGSTAAAEAKAAADGVAEKPATAEARPGQAATDARPAEVRGPYAELELTERQRAEIARIQAETQARIERLLAEQRQRILQTLSEEQKQQLEQHQQRAKELNRLYGMRGYLARLENQRDRLEAALAEAQQADDAAEVESLREQLRSTERKLADYRKKVEAQRAKVERVDEAE